MRPATTRAGRRRRTGLGPVLAAVLLSGLVGGCAAPRANPGSGQLPPTTAVATPATAAEPVLPARVGGPAKSTRLSFVPQRVTLPGGAHATVEPARTVDGELAVPEDVKHVGWWDGSASAGDPFGSTVIAGHVDSATEGLGYFARLLRVQVGDVVTVDGDGHRLSYRISAVTTVAKQALAADSSAFDQTGDHRLVLITCTGAYRRDQGGYASNLVVVAKPLGPVR